MPAGATIGLVTASHDGSSNFAVWAMDAANEQVDLLVNEIGDYAGTVPWGIRDENITSLQIEADGNWSITFAPLLSAPELAFPAAGAGSSVYIYRGGAATPTFSHQGESNFSVWVYGTSNDLLINEIGAYSGTHAMKAGPSVIVIEADGAWSIS